MNWLTLKADVASWMHRTDLEPQMVNFSLLSEAMINEKLRSPINETTLVTSFDDVMYTLPDDLIELLYVRMRGRSLSQVSKETLHKYRDITKPQVYTVHSGVIEFNGTIDPTAPIDGSITYTQAVLPVSTDTTFILLDKFPLLYLSSMLFQANSFVQDDEQAQKWLTIFNSQLNNINKTYKSSRTINPQVR